MSEALPERRQNDARLSVLESRVNDLVLVDQRIESTFVESHRRLEEKIDKLLTDSMPVGVARSMARIWTFAGVASTALGGALLHIAINS